MEKKRPILSIRPQFDIGLTMVQSLIVTAVGFIVATFVLGMLTYILCLLIGLGNHVSAYGIFMFYLIVSIAGIPPIFYELKKRAFQRTLYNFYEDYIDFQYFHFFINRRRGRVRYRDIGDITQHASALQEHQRLTTIYLYVPGMGYSQRGFSGIKLDDLPQSKGYLPKIMDLIEMGVTGVIPEWVAEQAAVPVPMPPRSPAAPPPVVAPPQPPAAAPASTEVPQKT